MRCSGQSEFNFSSHLSNIVPPKADNKVRIAFKTFSLISNIPVSINLRYDYSLCRILVRFTVGILIVGSSFLWFHRTTETDFVLHY
jgi:hypothetical protein